MSSQPKSIPAFQRAQQAFASHIRNPELHQKPTDVEDRRMKVYRELFYNNIENFCSNSFPVLRSLLEDNQWHQMVRGFMTDYQCHSPYFIDISQQFLDYLTQTDSHLQSDIPYMLELAHWEWMELKAFSSTKEISSVAHNPAGDLLNELLIVSPLAWPCAYEYPVHQIGEAYQPQETPEAATFLIISRNRADEVDFMLANPMTYRLLEILQSSNVLTGQDAIEQLGQEINYPDMEQLVIGGQQILQDLLQRDVILGTKLSNNPG